MYYSIRLMSFILMVGLVVCTAGVSHEKPRYIVLTDLSNEPDDEESLVRYLVYSNEFDTEGLIATTSTHLKQNPREDLIRRQLAAYAEVRSNLSQHAPGFPAAESLLAVTGAGQKNYGMADVGSGKGTFGSERIIEAVDRVDDRPLWIGVWGGANTLAQALHDVRESRTGTELAKFVSKLRVYSISDQDDAGPWLRREFPDLFYIVSPTSPHWMEYYRATWTGISGDRQFRTGVRHKFDMVDNPWLEQHVIKGHGPLGALYPPLAYIMEGDTPSFLGLIDRGLGWEISPAHGGWGGRYALFQPSGEVRPIWTETFWSRDTVTADNGLTETSNQATIWRWREHFQNDFAARMDWCAADVFAKANHNPRAVLNADESTDIITLTARHGSTVKLSAEGTHAGDERQEVQVTWWIYNEAGNSVGARLTETRGMHTEVEIPTKLTKVNSEASEKEVHVILQAEDDGVPRLFAYRRAIIRVEP